MIFAVFKLSPLTVCINCSFFTFIQEKHSRWFSEPKNPQTGKTRQPATVS